jgi:hypothetical protein
MVRRKSLDSFLRRDDGLIKKLTWQASMWHVEPVYALRAVIILIALTLAAPGFAGENDFVFVPQTDVPGNDLLKVDNSSFEDCARRCDARSDCNAFTYNQSYSVCFLKYAANRVTSFYAFAITGIRLSPSMLPTAGAFRSSGPSLCSSPKRTRLEATTHG